MTLVAAPPEDLAPVPRHPRARLARLWNAPFWVHVVALAIVLIVLVPFVGTDGSFSADEGPAIVQADSLADGDGWIVEHPLPEADTRGDNYPLESSQRGPRGFVPFGKHPLYPLLLAGAARLGGVTAMMLLSLAGTVAAAALGAGIARQLRPSLVRPTLWVVGLASPLLFDGYVVIAHTLGAAACAAAVLLATTAIKRRHVLAAVGVAPCIALAVLLRNEALFLALALAVTAAVIAVRRARLPALVVAAAAAVAGLSAHVVDREWTRNIVGGGPVGMGGSISNEGADYVAGRLKGFRVTWLTPTFSGRMSLALALFIMVGVLVVGAVLVRRRPADRGPILLLSGIAAASACVALALGPTNVVPGLLFAFPLVLPGLLLLRRWHLRVLPVQIALGTFVLFSAGVLATQYARGGSGEWGGRYFAIGIPILVPVLLLAMSEAGRRLDRPLRQWVAASLVVCCLATAAMAVNSLRHYHRFTASITAMVDRVSVQDGHPDRPVVIATDGITPRLSWPVFDDHRWLLASETQLRPLLAGLRAAGVGSFTLVTRFPDRDLGQIETAADGWQLERRGDVAQWQVLRFRLAGTGA